MPRVLSTSRCIVLPANEEEYLATVAQLAAECRARGQRFWVFRHATDRQRFIEFTEAATPFAHRVAASRTAEELRLEQKLRQLAHYAADAWDLYEEVPLTTTSSRPHDETDD